MQRQEFLLNIRINRNKKGSDRKEKGEGRKIDEEVVVMRRKYSKW